jgi:hypothetical protein
VCISLCRDRSYRTHTHNAGTPRDAAAAARWYRTAAARGHAKAAHALARLERLQELTTLGEQGQMGAQFKVSLCPHEPIITQTIASNCTTIRLDLQTAK